MHNKCIYIRNIYTRLNNTCADQHIVLSIKKIKDRLLQLRFRHLAMSDAYPSLRNKHRNLSGHFLNALHTIIEIVDLTATSQFTLYSFPRKRLTMLNNISLHGETVLRRRLNDR
ncbi:hypothetical protein D3C71_1211160 [compost metagenome]